MSSSTQVRTGAIYVFENGGVAPVAAPGSFETNAIVWTTAAPRARASTHSYLSNAVSTLLPGAEEIGQQSGMPAGRHIAYGAKALGALDSVYAVGQHAVQGNGAEAATASAKVGGGLAGAYAGAKALAPAGALVLGVPGAKAGAAVGAVFGALAGGSAAEALGEKLTGGPTPDKLGPPLTLPNHLKLDPTIVTAEGDRYALVNVEGKYSWFGMHDNPALPSRYIEVVKGAKVAELTRSYLDAAGFPEQAERHNAELAEQHRSALRDQFRRSETQYTNSLGPDGQPWGTPTRVAPNATTEWTHSPQPGQWLHTTRVHSGGDTETRITKSVDPARWQVVSEQVHERAHGVERLVGTTETMSGQGWKLDRSSGQMQPFKLDEEEAAQARMAPAAQNHRALNNEQLQQCHRQEAEQMVQSMHSVYALATGQASRPGSHASIDEAHADPQQREQAIEAGMGTFRRATAELLGAREVMRERGMELPEVSDVPDLSRHRNPTQEQTSIRQAPALTEQQQRHHRMAQTQLGPLLREHGHSHEQIERVSAAAVSHAQQFAHRGPVHSFLLSRDGASVAVLQESAPMSEFSVQAAQHQSPQQHMERAHALAQQQEQGRADSRREQGLAQHEPSQRSMA
ncbi:hypothetical protein J2W49_003703 [Hydrogenophaga palleronii]|uniref:Uncharacterized protein n=1 Tax=Hydrogenophaga palleronii TaxID=65655 RepID=A0ABU1WS44_9BURK|nr:hypothetical protein [Hydrogenophaga palleronii]MDR7151727.1 hypothetical protein [Hydrogenophaga palleronii]